jgi:hypothetical protein
LTYRTYIFQRFGSGFIDPGSGPNTDPDLIWIQGSFNKNLKKLTAVKKLIFFGLKIALDMSLGLHKERPSYRKSPK